MIPRDGIAHRPVIVCRCGNQFDGVCALGWERRYREWLAIHEACAERPRSQRPGISDAEERERAAAARLANRGW